MSQGYGSAGRNLSAAGSIRAGKQSKIIIKAAIFFDDEDDVLNDAGTLSESGCR
jgi:hypothetical protein